MGLKRWFCFDFPAKITHSIFRRLFGGQMIKKEEKKKKGGGLCSDTDNTFILQ